MKYLSRLNFSLIFIPFSILTLSLMSLFSVEKSLFKDQFFFIFLGCGVYFLTVFVNLDLIKKYSWYIFIFLLILNTFPMLFGESVRGSKRWINLYFTNFQPSEMLKIGFILFQAYILNGININKPSLNLLVSFLATLSCVFLLYLQPDLGTSILLLLSYFFLLIFKGLDYKKVFILILILGVFSFPLWGALKDYQKQRVVGFLNPTGDIQGSNYNVYQSMISIGSGGLFGKGLGRGTQSHLNFLPEYHTDFVFSSFSEEWGFFASLALIVLYLVLLFIIIKTSNYALDEFRSLISFGAFSFLFLQFFVNVGMSMGLMPVTGISLPLMSYGGSSLITFLCILGLIQNIELSR